MAGKGDFSRQTFNRAKHYKSVYEQQGRVMLDAESNEQADIQNYLRETVTRDVIGRTGAPRDDGGFRIGLIPNDVLISAGRFYVDGILCECEGSSSAVISTSGTPITTLVLRTWGADFVNGAWIQLDGLNDSAAPRTDFVQITSANANTLTIAVAPLISWSAVHFVRSTIKYTAQPDFPIPPNVTTGKVNPGDYIAYLDVWQRHITAIDDPLIRETALGIPDTTTRVKTLWQVVLKTPAEDCKAFSPSTATGSMAARTVPPQAASNPCEIPRSAGYRRLENQLYRVEIHETGVGNNATFKWSRDNGSIVFPIESLVANDQVRLRSYGLDDRLSLHVNDWVELVDDVIDLQLTPGRIVQVLGAPQSADPVVKLTVAVNTAVNFTRNPRLRLWARPDAAKAVRKLNEGANADGYVSLEDGIEVKFGPGPYRTGDYWLIPARTSISQETGSIEWPVSGGNPVSLPPLGIVHHYAPLAEIRPAATSAVEDCRPVFNPLSTPNLFYAGGDGQEVMPNVSDLTKMVPLPVDLRASVSNGTAIMGASVEFSIQAPGGGVLSSIGVPPGQKIVVKTDVRGIAACGWSVNSNDLEQTVLAKLLATDLPGFVPGQPPLLYNAHLSTGRNVAYHPGACTFLNDVTTVQDALDKLCKRPSGGICTLVITADGEWWKPIEALPGDQDAEICFRTGDFVTDHTISLRAPRVVGARHGNITITGTGRGSHIINTKPGSVFSLVGFDSVTVRDISLSMRAPVGKQASEEQLIGSLSLLACADVLIDHVEADCPDDGVMSMAGLSVIGAQRLRIHDCNVVAGEQQAGIVVGGPSGFILITGCSVRGVVRAAAPGGPLIVGSRLRTALFSNVDFTARQPNHNSQLVIGNQTANFTSDPRFVPMFPLLQPAIKTASAAVQDEAAARGFLDELPNRIVSDPVFARLAQNFVPGLISFAGLRTAEGIAIVGASAEVTLRDNVISDVGRGILCGVAYDANARPVQQSMRRVTIDNNEVGLLVFQTDTQPPLHGIDIGTCTSLLVTGNHIVASLAISDVYQSDGIHFNGELGGFGIIRHNHVDSTLRGYFTSILGATTPPRVRMSVLADNVAEKCFIVETSDFATRVNNLLVPR
jgi:hypothetical protein